MVTTVQARHARGESAEQIAVARVGNRRSVSRMDDFGEPGKANPRITSDALGFAALAAAALAFFATGSVAVLATVAACGCLAGSVVAAIACNGKDGCEGFGYESDDGEPITLIEEPGLCQIQQLGQERCWVQIVAKDETAGRGR